MIVVVLFTVRINRSGNFGADSIYRQLLTLFECLLGNMINVWFVGMLSFLKSQRGHDLNRCAFQILGHLVHLLEEPGGILVASI